MEWYDPTKWIDDINYGKDQIEALSEHFKVVLSHTTFDLKIALAEWKNFKKFVTVNYQEKLLANKIDAKGIWKQILCYHKSEFPNLTLLAQIIITLSGSNSAIEQSFNICHD